MSLRLVFMGSPDFAVPSLVALQKKYSIEAVYTQPDRKKGRGQKLQAPAVKKMAQELGIPVIQPEKRVDVHQLRELKPDLIVVVAFGQILKKEVLDCPPLGCVNIHSSLLPRWRGAAPIQYAILSGDKETGVTTMFMTEKLDAGAILLQEKTAISEQDTAESLHDRLAEMGSRLILETVEGLSQGTLEGRDQDEKKVTYASKLNKEMEWIQLSQTAAEVSRQIRALSPWPGCSLKLSKTGERLKIKRSGPIIGVERPGKLFLEKERLYVGVREGAVELLELQWEGKKPQGAEAFLNGLKGQGRSLPLELA